LIQYLKCLRWKIVSFKPEKRKKSAQFVRASSTPVLPVTPSSPTASKFDPTSISQSLRNISITEGGKRGGVVGAGFTGENMGENRRLREDDFFLILKLDGKASHCSIPATSTIGTLLKLARERLNGKNVIRYRLISKGNEIASDDCAYQDLQLKDLGEAFDWTVEIIPTEYALSKLLPSPHSSQNAKKSTTSTETEISKWSVTPQPQPQPPVPVARQFASFPNPKRKAFPLPYESSKPKTSTKTNISKRPFVPPLQPQPQPEPKLLSRQHSNRQANPPPFSRRISPDSKSRILKSESEGIRNSLGAVAGGGEGGAGKGGGETIGLVPSKSGGGEGGWIRALEGSKEKEEHKEKGLVEQNEKEDNKEKGSEDSKRKDDNRERSKSPLVFRFDAKDILKPLNFEGNAKPETRSEQKLSFGAIPQGTIVKTVDDDLVEAHHLALMDMGFADKELNEILIHNTRGNRDLVITWLVDKIGKEDAQDL
ncbi:hypothetical protein AAMO2058_001417200, partial [Amorphochlora amoebiformis]